MVHLSLLSCGGLASVYWCGFTVGVHWVRYFGWGSRGGGCVVLYCRGLGVFCLSSGCLCAFLGV